MLWLTLSLVLAAALVSTIPLSRAARHRATNGAATEATTTARVALAPLLITPDLQASVTGDRYQELSAKIRQTITVPGPVQHVILWTPSGEVLYDDDQVRVGSHDDTLAGALTEVANGGPMSRVHDGILETFVPMWLEADGPVAVAQLDRPVDPVTTAASGPWRIATIVLASLLAICLLKVAGALFRRRPQEPGERARATIAQAVRPDPRPTDEPASTKAGTPTRGRRSLLRRGASPTEQSATGPPAPEPSTAPTPTERPSRQKRPSRPGRPSAPATVPLYAHPDFKEFQREKDRSDERARAAEQRVRELQEQLRTTENEAAALRERLTLRQSQLATTEAELQDTRARIRDLESRDELGPGSGHVVVEAGEERPRVIIGSSTEDEAARLSERRG